MNSNEEKKDDALSPLLDKIEALEKKIVTLEKEVSDTTKLNRELLNRKQKENDNVETRNTDMELFRKFLYEEN